MRMPTPSASELLLTATRRVADVPAGALRIAGALLIVLASLAPPCLAQNGNLQQRTSPLRVAESDDHDKQLRMTPVVRAVQKAADSVVSIYIVHANALSSRQAVTEGQGSGVILDENGFVITNWHVVAPVLLGARQGERYAVQMKLKDGRALPATVLSSSPEADLALLQMQLGSGDKVQPVAIGRSAELMIGETVVAIGNPQGHANTVTSGVLSATGRSITVRAPDGVVRQYTGLLQTDAAINQGNSGGALLDITGKLIGINNAMAMGAENIGFAIPVDTVCEVFEKHLSQSDSFAVSADTAWLGLDVEERDGELVVTSVTEGSPAETAGVRRGDVIVRIADAKVATMIDYARRLAVASNREPIDLEVRRDKHLLQVTPQPMSQMQRLVFAAAGMLVEEVTMRDDPDLVERASRVFYRNYRQVPRFDSVVRIVRVQADSPAADLGLREGDLVLGYVGYLRGREADHPVEDARDLAVVLRQTAGRKIRLVVLRGNELQDGPLDVRLVNR
jgi:serine protease Do